MTTHCGVHRTVDSAKPSVKQHLAALRMLFNWLVTGGVLATNQTHAVRGPKHVVKRGKTPAKLLGICWAFGPAFGSRWRVAGDSLSSG